MYQQLSRPEAFVLAYHARTWKDVPTESQTIAVFNLTPLFFQSFYIHFDVLWDYGSWYQTRAPDVVGFIEGRREDRERLGVAARDMQALDDKTCRDRERTACGARDWRRIRERPNCSYYVF